MRTGCFVQMFDETGERFTEITTLKPECSFEMDVSYSSSEPQDIAVYLLENFAPLPFEVNGREALVHYLPVVPSGPQDDMQFSGKNRIQLSNIKFDKNEYAFLFVGREFLFVSRFQVNYPGGEQGAAPQGTRVEALPGCWEPFGLYAYASNQESSGGGFEIRRHAVLEKEFFLYHDITACYGEPLFGDFGEKSLTLPVSYAAVPVSFGKNGEIAVGRVIYYQSGEKQFYIKLGEETAPTEEEFQIVVFPYPYGFREDFNRTKRMELWSHLMMSNYLQKGE